METELRSNSKPMIERKPMIDNEDEADDRHSRANKDDINNKQKLKILIPQTKPMKLLMQKKTSSSLGDEGCLLLM